MSDISYHIVKLLLQKDEKAIDLIYDNYASNLYGYILNMLMDEDEAQDVLQECFIKIWKNAHHYKPERAKLFTWMMSICRHAAIDRLRKRDNLKKKEIQISSDSVYENEVELNIDAMDIPDLLKRLDTKYVDVIKSIFYGGLTHKEASESLNLPLGTVKSRLRLGLRELAKFYNQNNIISILLCLLWTIG